MLEWLTLTIPAETPKSAPVTVELAVSLGTVDEVWLFMPHGHNGLAHLQLWVKDHQLVPWTRGEWATVAGAWLRTRPRYTLTDQPTVFVLKGYNEDDTYPHTAYVAVEMDYGEMDGDGLAMLAELAQLYRMGGGG